MKKYLTLVAFVVVFVFGILVGDNSKKTVPTTIEIWRPTPVGESAVPVSVLTPSRVLRNGEPVFTASHGSYPGSWRVVLIYGEDRVSIMAD